MSTHLYAEEWRDVVGYEGLYQVSSHGRVKRIDGPALGQNGKTYWVSGRIRAQAPNRQGRMRVLLSKNGVKRQHQVHLLVLRAFVGPPPFEGAECRHFDGDHRNNCVHNLLWRTHGTRGRGANHPKAKLTTSAVRDVRTLAAQGIGQTTLAAIYGVSQVAIGYIIRRVTWKHVA